MLSQLSVWVTLKLLIVKRKTFGTVPENSPFKTNGSNGPFREERPWILKVMIYGSSTIPGGNIIPTFEKRQSKGRIQGILCFFLGGVSKGGIPPVALPQEAYKIYPP